MNFGFALQIQRNYLLLTKKKLIRKKLKIYPELNIKVSLKCVFTKKIDQLMNL